LGFRKQISHVRRIWHKKKMTVDKKRKAKRSKQASKQASNKGAAKATAIKLN
jgi:hypothetical protein